MSVFQPTSTTVLKDNDYFRQCKQTALYNNRVKTTLSTRCS